MSDLFTTLVEQCGRDVAEAVIEHFGGLRIYVPTKWTPDHMLNAMGVEHAKKLIEQFSALKIEVPQHRGAHARRRLARTLHGQGLTRNAVAKAVGFTERHVRRVVNEVDDDGTQGSLF